MFKLLSTPLARGLAIASFAVGVGAAVWRYSDVPPGEMIRTFAYTDTIKKGGCALWFLPGECDPVVDTGRFTVRFSDRPGDLPLVDVWPRGIPTYMEHWGVLLRNDAQAPAAFLEEMKPHLRNAALRDLRSFAGRLIAIPLIGLLSAVTFLGISILILRVGRWVKSGEYGIPSLLIALKFFPS